MYSIILFLVVSLTLTAVYARRDLIRNSIDWRSMPNSQGVVSDCILASDYAWTST